MFKWVRAERIYTPQAVTATEVLVAGNQIVAIGHDLRSLLSEKLEVDELDAGPGSILIPGLIDNHVHVIGGGGEGGFATRVPEITLTDITTCAVTTVIGVLGTDDVTRHLESLLAKARALENEGITTYMLTGSYSLPTPTLTDSVKRDMVLIDKVIGAGEIAISDHRASKADFQLLKDTAAGVRLGGLLSGKGGVLQLHVGDDQEGLEPVRRLVTERVLPAHQILPTHVNRTEQLLNEAAVHLQQGGQVDLTAFDFPSATALTAAQAIQRLLEAGMDLRNVTISSDANGSLPEVDAAGRVVGLRQAKMSVMLDELRYMVRDNHLSWPQILPVVTTNPARVYGLRTKGSLDRGMDADIAILCDHDLTVAHVMAKGQWVVRGGHPVVWGAFER